MTIQIKNIVSVMSKKARNNDFINIVELQQRKIDGVKLLTEKEKLIQFDQIVLFKINKFEKFGFCIKTNNKCPQESVVHLFYTAEESESEHYEIKNMKKVFCSNAFNIVEMHTYLLMLNANLMIEKGFDEIKDIFVNIFQTHSSKEYFDSISFDLIQYANKFKEEKDKVEKFLKAYKNNNIPNGKVKLTQRYVEEKDKIQEEIGKSAEKQRINEINKLIHELNAEKSNLLKSIGVLEKTKYKNKYEQQYQLFMSHEDEIKKLIIEKNMDYTGDRWRNAVERFENDKEVQCFVKSLGMTMEEILI
jgi:hypothetical protein